MTNKYFLKICLFITLMIVFKENTISKVVVKMKDKTQHVFEFNELKQIKFDNTTSISKETPVKSYINILSFPQPTSDLINFEIEINESFNFVSKDNFISIYDLNGNKITTLKEYEKNGNILKFQWNLLANNAKVPNGIYISVFTTNRFSTSSKFILN